MNLLMQIKLRYKKAGKTIKKHSPDAKRIKVTDAFKAKLAKTMKIQFTDEKEMEKSE